MPLASKPLQSRYHFKTLKPLLLLTGLVSASAIMLGEIPQKQVTALEVKSVRASNRSSWSGASFPVENFLAYSSPFGYRPSPTGGTSWEFHRGLDLAAPEGSYIRSWWSGNVVEVSDHTACGTSIKIQSGAWEHVYCHMKGHVEAVNGERDLIDREGGIYIKQGQIVPSGARIGRIGMTGRTTGPHLHWGLKYDGSYVDPGHVLRAMYAQQVPSGQMTVVRGQRVQVKDY